MKYFSHGDKLFMGVREARRFLAAHPCVSHLIREWWSGSDCIEQTEVSRADIMGKTARELTGGQTAQWAQAHGSFSTER